jgi:hypothetical protein
MSVPPINQRIKELIEIYARGSVRKFSQDIGVSSQLLNRVFNIDKRNGKHPKPSKLIISAIENKFVTLNPEWLLNGMEPMIINNPDSSQGINKKVFEDDDPCEKCKKLENELKEKCTKINELLEKNLSLSEELKELYKKYPHIAHPHQNGKSKAG